MTDRNEPVELAATHLTGTNAPSGLDETHSVSLRSWVESAHAPGTDFPVQNLPLGVITRAGDTRPGEGTAADSQASTARANAAGEGNAGTRVAIAIGDSVLDCRAAIEAGCFASLSPAERRAMLQPSLNALLALGRGAGRNVRRAASRLLRSDTVEGAAAQTLRSTLLVPARDVTTHVPAVIGDYTDFYASLHHAMNVGALFRPDNPLLPNYKHLPVGYHGRASSIVVSGTPVRRPHGQLRPDANAPPVFEPSKALDYELELGAWVCGENALGAAVPLAQAEHRLFGLSLLNDWSARDIQTWEYQPLGPFLAKNFATSVGAWMVTLDALAPFRAANGARAADDPDLLPYLRDASDAARGGFDITLEVWLESVAMRRDGAAPVQLSHGNFTSMYWTFAQMLTHHASNGCNLRAADVLGSGTVSGAEAGARGCLLELTRRGAEPVRLPSGESRAFLADGDVVILKGWCERAGAVRIGFGECRGELRAAT